MQESKDKRQNFRALVVTLIIGVALYLGAAAVSDITEVASSIWQMSLVAWLIVLLLSLLNYGMRFLRWHAYLLKLGYFIPIAAHLLYYVSGFAFTTTPGKAGEAIRSAHLKHHGVNYASSIAALFAERFADLLTIVFLASLGFAKHENMAWVMYVGLVLCMFILSFLWHPAGYRLLESFTQARSPDWFNGLSQGLTKFVKSVKSLLTSKLLLTALAIGVPAWFAEAVGFYIIMQQLGQQISVLEATGVYALGMLAGALSFIPGGLGSTEAVMILLLSALGVPPPQAIAGTLICRIATLWFSVLLGFIATVIITLRQGSSRTFPKET